jgi:hypothetical protein
MKRVSKKQPKTHSKKSAQETNWLAALMMMMMMRLLTLLHW